MTRSTLLFSISLFLTLPLMLVFSSHAKAQSALDGSWQTGEDNTIVKIETVDGTATGKLVSSDNTKARAGTEIVRDFQQVEGIWTGKIFAAKRNKLMDATITPAADSLNIKVSAGMMSKKLVWTRTKK